MTVSAPRWDMTNVYPALDYSYSTTDSRNKEAMRILSEFEQVNVKTSILQTRFTAWAGKLGKPAIKKADKTNPSAKAHEFILSRYDKVHFVRFTNLD